MPKEIWVVQDTTTNLYLSVYSPDWWNSQFVSQPLGAIHFDTEADADAVIASWESAPEGRFIGKNPPVH